METLFYIILPLFLTAMLFTLKPVSRWLKMCVAGFDEQEKHVEAFQDSVAKFLRISSPNKHEDLRDLLVWVGHHMMDGNKLVKGYLRVDQHVKKSSELEIEADEEFDNLPDQAKQAFAVAIGHALIVSSYQSFVFGSFYRGMLYWALKKDSTEAREPTQIVYSFEKANKIPIGGPGRSNC